MLEVSLLNSRLPASAEARTVIHAASPRPHSALLLTKTLRRACEWLGALMLVGMVALLVVPGNRAVLAQLSGNLAAYLQNDEASGSSTMGWHSATTESLALSGADEPSATSANVTSYLARRYHVADSAMRILVSAAQTAGQRNHLDPLLILAVMAVESGMNPFAQSTVGATGLMQVMPDLHRAKLATVRGFEPLDPVTNIHAGTQILSNLIERGGSVERGLQLYVGAGNSAGDSGYSARVIAEFSRLQQAARGQVAAALLAGMKADQARQAEAGTL